MCGRDGANQSGRSGVTRYISDLPGHVTPSVRAVDQTHNALPW